MRIDDSLLHFCAKKTAEVSSDYDKHCRFKDEIDGFPRSVDDLETLIRGLYAKPIRLRQLGVSYKDAKYRSFYMPREDGCDIYFAQGIPSLSLRYYKAKELLQLHLWQESLRTHDVVDLVQNMILRAMPESLELDLGHAATSDTLGDIAAMEFLFPCAERRKYTNPEKNGFATVVEKFRIPAFIAQRCFSVLDALEPYFHSGENGK